MKKIYTEQVNQLRMGLINQIKMNFIKPEGGDISIEFNQPFTLWTTEEDTYSDDHFKVRHSVEGLRVEDNNIFLSGTNENYEEFDELDIEDIWDPYVLAYIADAVTQTQYQELTDNE